jgi:hypothetical protein
MSMISTTFIIHNLATAAAFGFAFISVLTDEGTTPFSKALHVVRHTTITPSERGTGTGTATSSPPLLYSVLYGT